MIGLLIALTLLYAFSNGLNDSPAIVAPVISTRTLGSRQALLLTAAAQAAGPLVVGTAVATTIATRIVRPESMTSNAVLAALAAAVFWSGITWLTGLPSSSSHALVGGLVGAALVSAGPKALLVPGFARVVAALVISPPLGLLIGYLGVWLTLHMASRAKPTLNNRLRRWQLVAMLALGASHGASDAPKAMGVLMLGLVAVGAQKGFAVPAWVFASCLGFFCLGTSIGGWRQIRTLGGRIYHLRPVHGFGALVSGTMIVLAAAMLGRPISMTQVMASAILGAGAADRPNKVRWLILREMLTAWILTIPATLLLSAGVLVVLNRL